MQTFEVYFHIPVPGVTCKRADGTNVTDSGQNDVRPVSRETFADRGKSNCFAERAWQFFLGKRGDYYSVLEEQDCVTGYWDSPVISEGGQGNLTPGADSNIVKLPEVFDEDENCDLDGATGGECAHRDGVKRKLLDLQYECWTMERSILPNVAEAVEVVTSSYSWRKLSLMPYRRWRFRTPLHGMLLS